jgi:signal transduction histidine kinase
MSLRETASVDSALAAACAVALLADSFIEGSAQSHPFAAVGLSIAACVPLVWRSSHPLAALVASMLGLIACAAVLRTGNGSVAVALVPAYSVSALGGRRRSVAIAVAMTVVLTATTVWLEDPIDFRSGAVRLLSLIVAITIGDIVRTRRALRAEATVRLAREQRERESEDRRRLADERLRVARDVHDSIAHALVAINVRAGVAAHLGAAGDPQAALLEIKDVSAEALGDLRATLGLLRQEHDVVPTAPALGLEALPQLLERTRNAGLSALSEIADLDAALPTPVGQVGFRIVQESLTNVLRHADAKSARVRIRIRDGALEISVEDDGTGVPGEAVGHGLRGMNERVDALGGTLVAGPRPEGGWRVHALLPLVA